MIEKSKVVMRERMYSGLNTQAKAQKIISRVLITFYILILRFNSNLVHQFWLTYIQQTVHLGF